MDSVIQGNIERFSGFAEDYDKVRPEMPPEAITIILKYLERKPECIIDLGSGTGLSTLPWENYSTRIIGVEPNKDMLAIAAKKATHNGHVNFIQGVSNDTGLDDNCSDIVTCSQSFHWMEPTTTLKEVARILKEGGVFSTYDCDWPVCAGFEVEAAYNRLFEAVWTIEKSHPEIKGTFKQWNKSGHLDQIRKCGLFRFSKEIVFHHVEKCDSQRFIGLALSQGGLQSVLKNNIVEIIPFIEDLERITTNYFSNAEKEIIVCYRMRLAVK